MWPILLFIVVVIILYYTKRPKLYPPGPPFFPFLGNLLTLWFNLKRDHLHHVVWQKWSEIYGDILGLKLGLMNVVIVFGRERIKEVCLRDVFDGRPDGFFYTMRSFGKKIGIVFSDGSSWYNTRRVVLKYLKNFGYGSRTMEAMITDECKELVKLRLEDKGKPVKVNHMFDISVVNIMWRFVAGRRYNLKDKKLKQLCDLTTRSFKMVDMSGGILNCMPFLRHIIPGYSGYTEMKEINNALYKFIKETIKEHENDLNINQPRDLIDTFLIEMIQGKDGAFTDKELQVVCLDLLQAGVETVANTFTFMLLHIALNEEVQKEIHDEIDDIIERRPPSLGDRTRMIYTEAVILETLRIATVPSVGIPHMALEDAQLGEYVVPKGTFILTALHDLHNGEHWLEPEKFSPERFLTRDRKLRHDDWLMPFGTGRRRCIGEVLARTELFLFLTFLLQRFYIELPEADPLPSTEPVDGISLSPQPFRLTFSARY